MVAEAAGERELIARAKRGEVRAYEQLVEHYQATAFRLAWLLAGSAADAEEATQDAFLKAFRALDRFRSGAPFRPWLLRIVANEARNRRVAMARRERLALRAREHPAASTAPSPEAALLDLDARAELLAALRRLDERDRLTIACRYFLDLSEAETAAALDCRRGTVKSRLSRALARLRTELEAADE